MPNTIPSNTLEKFTTFGDLLRFLRRRAGMTQLEFSIAVGYSDSQISRLEQNMRLPDPPMIEARFVPALCLEEEPLAITRLIELAAHVRREVVPALGMCPYKGLEYFDEADADLFVGRELLVEKLTQHVLSLKKGAEPGDNRFFAVVGASGSGKSSLVRAGLIPSLRWNKISANWLIYILTPTAHPLESLANCLIGENSSISSMTELMDNFCEDRRTLSLFSRRLLKPVGGAYLLVLVDQFEEVFSLCRSDSERASFIDNLVTAAAEPNGNTIVIVTLRADFYAHCANHLQLREAIASHQEYIGALSDDEMRRAIEEPAQHGRWEFEPGLVDLILHDVGNEPGALPLLSHALLETWHRRHGRNMTLGGYTATGGVRGAIAETAQSVFTDQLDPVQQAIAKRIFLRLTELGDATSTGDTRRRTTFDELVMKPEETEATRWVLKTLSDARLITVSEDSIQVAHEALIREWPTLRGWLEENREGFRLHRQLTDATQEWQAEGREVDLLFRGVRLAQAQEWAASHPNELNTMEREFLDASMALSAHQVAEQEAARLKELQSAQKLAETERQRAEDRIRSAKRLRLRTVLISIISTVSIILALFAIYTWQQSVTHSALNQSLNLASAALQANRSGREDLAIALAIEAIKVESPPVDVIRALREIALSPGTRAVLYGPEEAARVIAISPNGDLAVTGGCQHITPSGACESGELVLWSLAEQEMVLNWPAHASMVTALSFTQDGRMIISGAEDGSLALWNLEGNQIRQLIGHESDISSIATLAHTSLFLSGSGDGEMILWEWKTGEMLQKYNGFNPITSLAAAEAKFIAVSAHQDNRLMLWDLYKDYRLYYPTGINDIDAVAISPDGTWVLITTHGPAEFRLYKLDSENGVVKEQLDLPCESTHRLALSSDGSFVLVSCQSAIYKVDVQPLRVEHIFLNSTDSINDIAVSKDGLLSLVSYADGSLRIVSLGSELEYEISDTQLADIVAAEVSSDELFWLVNDVSGMPGDQPGLWDMQRGEIMHIFSGFDGESLPGGNAISPDTQSIAIAGWKRDSTDYARISPTVMVWDRSSQEVLCKIDEKSGTYNALEFSPDSTLLAVAWQDQKMQSGRLSLWEVQSCQQLKQFSAPAAVTNLDFSSDGTRLAAGISNDEKTILWDAGSGEEIKHFTSLDGSSIHDVVFGPDDLVLLGTGTGELYLWDVNSTQVIRTYSAQKATARSAIISPRGRYVLAGTLNGDLILWDFNTGEELRRLSTQLDLVYIGFSLDETKVIGVARNGESITWHIAEKSLSELVEWVKTNRYQSVLSCDERELYHVEPLCAP